MGIFLRLDLTKPIKNCNAVGCYAAYIIVCFSKPYRLEYLMGTHLVNALKGERGKLLKKLSP